MPTRIPILLALLSVLAPAAFAGEADARSVAAPPALAASDHAAVLAAAAAAIEADPESPLVPAAVLRLERSRAFAAGDAAVTERLLAVLAKGVRNGRNDEALRRYVRERLREAGRIAEGEALGADRGYVLRWAVLGPFGFDAASLLDRRYEPEETIDFARAYRDAGKVRRFMVLPPDDDASIEPFDALPGSGVAYAVAQVRAAAPGGAILAVESPGSVRIWLNGTEVLRVDRLRERLGRTLHAGVVLREGWNRIVAKCAGRARFSLKVCEPGTLRPVDGLEEEEGLVLHDVGALPAEPIDVLLEPRPEEILRNEGGPWALGAAAMLLEGEGLDLEALDAADEAVEAAPDDPGLRYLRARILETAEGLPEVYRKNLAKLALAAALEREPAYGPAIVKLAELKHADDRSEEAAAALRGRLEANPADVEARWALCRVASDRGWEKESLDAAMACLESVPSFRPAILFLATNAERYGDVAAARGRLETALEASRDDYETLRRLARHDAAAGDLEAALRRHRRIGEFWPRFAGCRVDEAAVLADLGRTAEAVALLDALSSAYPASAFYPRRAGDVLRAAGDADGARARYRRSLEVDSGQPDLRRALERMDGEESDFSLPWETEVLDLVPGAPGRDRYPKAPAVCLLDQTVLRVWPDGSSSSVVHMAFKLLDEKGVEKYGRVETTGETLEVRTIDAAGKIWEPIGVTGGSYNMPALAPGVVVEYRYRADSGTPARGFDSQAFYFADPDYENAVLLSRWIVILPKDFEADWIVRNFTGKHEVEERGDLVVHVFELRDSPRVEQEPFMPGRDRILPWARLLRKPPVDDAAWPQADRFWRGIAPTPLVERTAAEVTKGVRGEIAKAKALHAWVNEQVTGDFSYGGPTATILEKAGDRFDLFASLLLAAGVPFEPGAAASDRGRGADLDLPGAQVFDLRCLKLTPAGGEPVWVCDAPRLAPFGRIPDDYRDSPVLVLGRTGGRIESLPPEPDADHENRTLATISLGAGRADTAVDLRFEYRQDGGWGFKERMRRVDADDRRQTVEGWVSGMFTGPSIESFDFPDVETPGAVAVLAARAKLPNFLQPDGEAVKCGLGISSIDFASTYVGKPERIHPMEISADWGQDDTVTIDLGGAWSISSLPADHVTIGPLGYYSLTIESADGRIVVRRKLRFRPADLTKDEYPALVEWVKDIDEAEGRSIRLVPRRPSD